jgi:hypothetical protein
MNKKNNKNGYNINMRLKREDFFGHEKIIKLTTVINKKTIEGYNYMTIKDQELITLLIENKDWLDYVGITIKSDKLTIIKWSE